MQDRQYFVYIIGSPSGVLYIGVTNDLEKRVWQHKNKIVEGFTKKHNCIELLYYEATSDVNAAITREKQLKKWSRDKKELLIRSMNPQWRDLAKNLFSQDSSTRFEGSVGMTEKEGKKV